MRPKLLTKQTTFAYRVLYLGDHSSVFAELISAANALGVGCTQTCIAPMRRLLYLAEKGALRYGREVKLIKLTLPLPIFKLRASFQCQDKVLLGRAFCAEVYPPRIILLAAFVKKCNENAADTRRLQNEVADLAARNLRRALDTGYKLL